MRFGVFAPAALAAAVLAFGTSAAQSRVNVTVDLSTQRMHVTSSSGSYTWKVSTGRGRYNTPRGTYRPTVMRRMHYSRKYNNSPMPYSVFFRGGYAIHGTNAVSRLGSPASHGCVRLATRNAAALYSMIKREGARITIVGSRAKFYASQRGSKKKYASVKKSGSRVASASRSASGKVYYVKRYKRGKTYFVKRYKNGKLVLVKRYKKGKVYYAKRYKSKTANVNRISKKRYAKTYASKRKYVAKRSAQKHTVAARTRSSQPLAFAPAPRKRSTFDFFHNPNNY